MKEMEGKLSEESLQPVRGARDFFGGEKRRRDQVVELMKATFQYYSFEPLETPALERMDVLASKFAGGDEIMKEIFKVNDQGNRELGLRYDLTVPLCRYIALNKRLQMPFKRYAIANVWRDGPLKTGRYREFCQCDVDTVGVKSMLADAEILKLSLDIFQKLFKENFIIKVSNRKLLDGILEEAGVKEGEWLQVILIVDKLQKIGANGVKGELSSAGIEASTVEKITELILLEGTSGELIKKFASKLNSQIAKEGMSELKQLFDYAAEFGCEKYLQFDPSLARGLNYYTSTIFEVFLKKGKLTSSIAAGGRYDNLIGKFAGTEETIPAVGISFGVDVIMEALREIEEKPIVSGDVLIAVISKEKDGKELKYAIKAANQFRNSNIRTSLDLLLKNIGKNMEIASRKGFGFVAIIGEKEMKEEKVTIRNMQSGEEKTLSIQDAIKLISGS